MEKLSVCVCKMYVSLTIAVFYKKCKTFNLIGWSKSQGHIDKWWESRREHGFSCSVWRYSNKEIKFISLSLAWLQCTACEGCIFIHWHHIWIFLDRDTCMCVRARVRVFMYVYVYRFVYVYVFLYVFMYVCTLEELKLQGINIRNNVLPRFSRAKCFASDFGTFCTTDHVSV